MKIYSANQWHTRRFPKHGGALRISVPLIALLLLLAGCQSSGRRDQAQETLSRPVAVVNNEKITFEAFQNTYQLFLSRWDTFVGADAARRQEVRRLVLEDMIEEVLLDQEARRRGIQVTEDDVNRETRMMLSSYEKDNTGRDWSQTEGLNDWKRDISRRLVREKLIQKEVVSKINITAAEMRRYYDKHKETFRQPERVKVRHIAVGSRTLYNRVRNLIGQNRDFVALVRKYSITPDRFEDGELGFVERGVLPPEFDEAIFSMSRVGSISQSTRNPVKTEMGYHIFRLEGRQPAGIPPFSRAKAEIEARLLAEKQPLAYEEWLAQLRDRSTIRIDQDLLLAE